MKFGPEGGRRLSDPEKWAFRGAGFINNFCGNCIHHLNMLAVDDADHIFAGDPVHHCIKVLDAAGNMIQCIGRYGNAEVYPARGGDAKELAFHNIYTLSAAGQFLCVTDRDLKRVALVNMDYRQRWRSAETPD